MGEILDPTKTDLEMTNFATISAIKGTQFGKDVYSSVVKFNDLHDFLAIFPNVQRNIVPRKVNSIRRYILSGLQDSGSVNMRFFSAVTVTCKATLYYDEKNHRCAIDTHRSKLSINDGQHRFEAISTLIIQLENQFLKTKDKMKQAKLRDMISRLKEMVIPVVIFDDLSESEEKQLFHDLNNLAQRPSRNSNIRLNQTDLFSRMARELAVENRYLKHYGVEMDKMIIAGNSNPNTVLLSTIYSSIKELLGLTFRQVDSVVNDENYDQTKKFVSDTLDKLFFNLPSDINVRKKYLIEKSFVMKAIARFICHSRNHLDLQLPDEEIFKIIGETDWSYNFDFWSQHGGTRGVDNNILWPTSAGGTGYIYNYLMNEAEEASDRLAKEKAEGKVPQPQEAVEPQPEATEGLEVITTQSGRRRTIRKKANPATIK